MPEHVKGLLHNPLIRAYQNWKGTSHVPEKTDTLLRWTENDPMQLLPAVTDTAWHLIEKYKVTGSDNKAATSFVPENSSKPTVNVVTKHALDQASSSVSKKQKRHNTADDSGLLHWDHKKPGSSFVSEKGSKPTTTTIAKHPLHQASSSASKRQKRHNRSDDSVLSSPLGPQWDQDNYSCAYDAFYGILYQIWVSNPDKWTEHFNQINEQHLVFLLLVFGKC